MSCSIVAVMPVYEHYYFLFVDLFIRIMKLLKCIATHISAKPCTNAFWKATIMQITAKFGIWSLTDLSAETMLFS